MDLAKAFLNKLAEDQGMQAVLTAAIETAVTKEEKVSAITKVANEAGFAVSADELQKMAESIQASSVKLSDDDLENVAGGYGFSRPSDDSIVTGVIVGVVVGALIADAIINDK